jgi:PKD repeat protein
MKKILLISAKILIALFIYSAGLLNAQCSANFSFSITNGTVSFVNTSSGTYSTSTYNWYFGDGNSQYIQMNNSGNTAHTYSSNGVYTVTLTINDSLTTSCNSTISQTLAITTASCLGGASFQYNIYPNGVVDFTNTSGGSSLTYTWGFGDGNTSNATSPTHTYSTSAIYNVSLTATTPSATCTFSTLQSFYVNVSPCNLVASYSSAINNNTVSFTNTSAGTSTSTQYAWYFGDGSSSNFQNPTHTYSTSGTYYVILQLTDNAGFICNDSIGGVVTVTNGPCSANASFNIAKDSLLALTWNISPTISGGVVTGILWNWGDGSTSSSMFPSHSYSAAGTYSICLSVTISCASGTATATYCSLSSIYRMAGGNDMIYVRVIDPSNPVGVSNIKSNDGIRLYPNPSNGKFKLETADPGTHLKITDISGTIVFSESLGAGVNAIDLQDLAAGIYFVRIISEKDEIRTKLVIAK